jgi:hypothetical protein
MGANDRRIVATFSRGIEFKSRGIEFNLWGL